MTGFVIAFDTICSGWDAIKDEDESPIVYATLAEAESDKADFDRMALELEASNAAHEGESFDPDEWESDLFIVPSSEYVQGRKAIWSPSPATEGVTP